MRAPMHGDVRNLALSFESLCVRAPLLLARILLSNSGPTSEDQWLVEVLPRTNRRTMSALQIAMCHPPCDIFVIRFTTMSFAHTSTMAMKSFVDITARMNGRRSTRIVRAAMYKSDRGDERLSAGCNLSPYVPKSLSGKIYKCSNSLIYLKCFTIY
uniref:uncharacterized protein LOC105349665 n=1 Tax=Fragaria vesca subsp. vesca TaxID=101020 RepID=UPI0005C814E3|nr:PREDICTED: uncharacterized protein LOC105349665 [Fragaria vesca subsp. vesca]